MTTLRVHDFIAASRCNGPGLRAVLWLQGCTLACPGCFNPLTHSALDGTDLFAEEIVNLIKQHGADIEGVTISGGEPLQQAGALLDLLRLIRRTTSLGIIVFTGFSWEEFLRLPQAAFLQANMDVLIAGRYKAELRQATGLIGSSNKTMHFFTNQYIPADFEDIPEAEVILGEDGELRFSGIDPLLWS